MCVCVSCACVSLLQTGTWSPCFEWVWMRERDRERERAIAQHILSLTSSSSPDRRNSKTHTFVNVSFRAHNLMTTTSLFPLASPHWELSLDLWGLVDRANHEGHYCVCIWMRRVCVCVWVSEWERERVHVHLLFIEMSWDYRYSFWIHVLFLYVYECTFVPKNLDRVHGHWDINSFLRAGVTCVSAQHSVCKVWKFVS